MNTERLRKILKYSEANRAGIEDKVKKIRSFAGIGGDADVLDILQIIRPVLKNKGFWVLEIPFADKEIGALCYKGDSLGYIVINTSLPKVNTNFAICHEVYHVFYQASEYKSKVEFANDDYFEYEEEYAANLFAGMLLMPETGFRRMYGVLKKESNGSEQDTIFRLMNYYQVPYMAALIRCYELGLPESNTISEELLTVNRTLVRERFAELWLDDMILEATKKDDFPNLEKLVENVGTEYINESYINERTLKKVLQNIKTLYSEIRG